MRHYILLTGTNIGNKKENLTKALEELVLQIGEIQTISSVYVTKAWGKTDQEDFYNQVIGINSIFPPEKVLETINLIEMKMGRVREIKWGERIIDIDILFVDNEVIDTETLKVPHPELHNRRFTLVPLIENYADFIHPIMNKTIKNILEDCPDKLKVTKLL